MTTAHAVPDRDEAPVAISLGPLPADVAGPARFGRLFNIAKYMRDPVRSQMAWAARFRGEPVVAPTAGDARIILTFGAEALRHMSTRQGDDGEWTRPEAGGLRLPPGSRPALALRGMSTTNGAEHLRRRRAAVAATHGREALAPLCDAFGRTAVELVDRAPSARALDLVALCAEASLRNSMTSLFGIADDDEARERLGEVATILKGASSPSTLLLQKDWPLLPYRAWLRAAERLYDWGARVVEQKRAEGAETSSMLAKLVALRDEDGSHAALERLVGDAVTIYIVGHDSTSQQTTWALLMLAAHPHAQAEVREELASVLGGRAPTVADALPALDAALNEAMRLLPATFALNPRIARRDLELERNGVTRRVPRGAMAFGAILAAHYDESSWQNATTFDPKRWSGSFKPEPYAFLPFGQGSRRCIGDMVAWHQMRAVAATLLQRHFITPASPSYDYEANVIQLKPVGTMKVSLSRSAPARPKTTIGLRGNVAKDLVRSLS